ncbi:MAG: hypothetical protein EOP39_16040 [Rubrivivax sp.]|nr:MAG: hypothetical protein EOP39_16040 [Rubrivivax sp.]
MTPSSRLPLLAALFAIAAFMLLAHPYEGVRHDGVLYLGQALLHSLVPGLAQDVFFSGGSQDRYSIYSQLMVPLYQHLGVQATHVTVLIAGWVGMLGAVWGLLRRLEPAGWPPLWGTFAVAVMSSVYGGNWVFGYAENFVTARSFAEPLLLWSLLALLTGRRGAAVALQVAAALFHPLMTLPVIAVAWCFLAEKDRRWLWLLAAVPAALLAGALGLPPWDGLFKTYDPYWWALVETGNRQVLLGNWTLSDQLNLALDVAVLLAVCRLRPLDDGTRLLYAAVVITVTFVGLAALGADGLGSVLLTQLQLWRAHWVSHLLAMALAPWLLARLWQRGGLWPASACALALALLNAHIGMEHAPAALALWALVSLAAWRAPSVSRATVGLACGGIALTALGLSLYQVHDMFRQLAWQTPATMLGDGFYRLAAFPTVAACGFAALLTIAAGGPLRKGLALGLSLALLGFTLAHWDQRTDLVRAVESAPRDAHPFARFMPASATVYWPDKLLPVWSLLRHPSHYAAQQGAGVLFNRDTGLVFGPRKELYRRIDEDREHCQIGASIARDMAAKRACEMPTTDRLTTLCSQPDAPDFLVLRGALGQAPLATWQPPAHRDPPQTFNLHACSQLITPSAR